MRYFNLMAMAAMAATIAAPAKVEASKPAATTLYPTREPPRQQQAISRQQRRHLERQARKQQGRRGR